MKKALALLLGLVLGLGLLAGCSGGAASSQGGSAPASQAASGGATEAEPVADAPKDPVRIATKPMTEQFITSEMLGLLIEQAGYSVEITKGIGGGTSNIMPAMEKGEFDLYTEYTGTGWLNVLGHEEVPAAGEELEQQLNEQYNEQYDMSWVGSYGFNNTYAIAVRNEVVDEYGLVTMSDLAKAAPQLTFGGNGDFFERADGFDALCEAYGYTFDKTVDIDIGLKYTALDAGEIDVTNAFTTDAQLEVADMSVLEDDKGYFTEYYACTVVRNDALEKYPELRGALEKMNGILDDAAMAGLSYKVDVDGMDEKDVAREFLESKGLL